MRVHLVPAERAHRRMIDGERVCEAIAALQRQPVEGWAERLALLGDPSRLCILVCMRAGPISVSDLAVAADLPDPKVSQILRLLRAHGVVSAHRDGRVVRYSLEDEVIAEVLDCLAASRQGAVNSRGAVGIGDDGVASPASAGRRCS